MRIRWGVLLIIPAIFSFGLLLATQIVFLRLSFYEDLGLGLVGNDFQFGNYVAIFTDSFYLRSFRITVYVSALVVGFSLLFSYPVAYVLARMRSRWSSVLLAAVVITTFITIVIKVLGLVIIFGADGPLNTVLLKLSIIEQPLRLLGSLSGVVIGLLHYTLGLTVLVLFSVIQTIPRALEEAAEAHGATRMRVFMRVVLPLSLPGLVAASLITFNLSMGAFTSAALLGGGRVLTLPVLIQREVILETSYATASALAAVLLVAVLLINLLSVFAVSRLRVTRVVPS